jgi:hypothetical protein
VPQILHVDKKKVKIGDYLTVTGVRIKRDDGTPMVVKEFCVHCKLASDCHGCQPVFEKLLDGSYRFQVPSHAKAGKGTVAVHYEGHGDDYSYEKVKVKK